MQNDSVKKLAKVPLFHSVKQSELAKVAEFLKLLPFKANTVIIREGDIGNCLFIIKKGRVKVTAQIAGEEDIVLSALNTGDYFGEMALITGEPRSATVIAQTDVELWRLDKKDFDSLLLTNPKITLSLTHMLSQRLKNSNRIREQREIYYRHKISPKGTLDDFNVFNLLKYAEENTLTGKIVLSNAGEKARLYYEKGHLAQLDFVDKNEDEALDILLQWESGEFIIEPRTYEIADDRQQAADFDALDTHEIFEHYFLEKLVQFVRYSGNRTVQSAVNKSFHKFEPYFQFSREVTIEILPKFRMQIYPQERWNEKYTLFLAILLRDIVRTLEQDLIGISFLELHSSNNDYNDFLKSMQFFDFYDQALDFIRD